MFKSKEGVDVYHKTRLLALVSLSLIGEVIKSRIIDITTTIYSFIITCAYCKHSYEKLSQHNALHGPHIHSYNFKLSIKEMQVDMNIKVRVS